jgi:hypothetical protein
VGEPETEITFRLRVRRDPGSVERRQWFYVPIDIGEKRTLAMVPNTMASRSVITTDTAEELSMGGLVGADIVDLSTGRRSHVLRGLRLAGHPIPDFAVRVREVPGLRGSSGVYVVDGYLGLDFFFGLFRLITIDTRTLKLTLRPDEQRQTGPRPSDS